MTPLSLDPTIRTLCYYLALKITLITLMMNKQHKIYIYRYIYIYLFIYLFILLGMPLFIFCFQGIFGSFKLLWYNRVLKSFIF